MATLPQYKAGKLASRVVGATPEDQSGAMMVNAGLRNQGALLDSEVAASGAAAQGVDQLFNAGMGVLNTGIDGFTRGYTKIAAKNQAEANARTKHIDQLQSDLLANDSYNDLARQMNQQANVAKQAAPADSANFYMNGGDGPNGSQYAPMQDVIDNYMKTPALMRDPDAAAKVKMQAANLMTSHLDSLGKSDRIGKAEQTIQGTVSTVENIAKYAGQDVMPDMKPFSGPALRYAMDRINGQQSALTAVKGGPYAEDKIYQENTNAVMNWATGAISSGSEDNLRSVENILRLHSDNPGINGISPREKLSDGSERILLPNLEGKPLLDSKQIDSIRSNIASKRAANDKALDDANAKTELSYKSSMQYNTHAAITDLQNGIPATAAAQKQTLTNEILQLTKQQNANPSKLVDAQLTQTYHSLGEINAALGQKATKDQADAAAKLGVQLETEGQLQRGAVEQARGDLAALQPQHEQIVKAQANAMVEAARNPTKENKDRLQNLNEALAKSTYAVSQAEQGIEKSKNAFDREQKEKAEAEKKRQAQVAEENKTASIPTRSKLFEVQERLTKGGEKNPDVGVPGSPSHVSALKEYADTMNVLRVNKWLSPEEDARWTGDLNARTTQAMKSQPPTPWYSLGSKSNEQMVLDSLVSKAPDLLHRVLNPKNDPATAHALDTKYPEALSQSLRDYRDNAYDKNHKRRFTDIRQIPIKEVEMIKDGLNVQFAKNGVK